MLLVVTRGASSLLYPFEDSNSTVFTFQPHVCSAASDNTFGSCRFLNLFTACLGQPLDHKSSAVTGANLATLLLNLKTKVPKFAGRSEYTDAPSPVGACEINIDGACARYTSMGGGRGWCNDTSRGGPAGTMSDAACAARASSWAADCGGGAVVRHRVSRRLTISTAERRRINAAHLAVQHSRLEFNCSGGCALPPLSELALRTFLDGFGATTMLVIGDSVAQQQAEATMCAFLAANETAAPGGFGRAALALDVERASLALKAEITAACEQMLGHSSKAAHQCEVKTVLSLGPITLIYAPFMGSIGGRGWELTLMDMLAALDKVASLGPRRAVAVVSVGPHFNEQNPACMLGGAVGQPTCSGHANKLFKSAFLARELFANAQAHRHGAVASGELGARRLAIFESPAQHWCTALGLWLSEVKDEKNENLTCCALSLDTDAAYLPGTRPHERDAALLLANWRNREIAQGLNAAPRIGAIEHDVTLLRSFRALMHSYELHANALDCTHEGLPMVLYFVRVMHAFLGGVLGGEDSHW